MMEGVLDGQLRYELSHGSIPCLVNKGSNPFPSNLNLGNQR